MKNYSLTAAGSMLGLALVLSPIARVEAAELRVLASGAMATNMFAWRYGARHCVPLGEH